MTDSKPDSTNALSPQALAEIAARWDAACEEFALMYHSLARSDISSLLSHIGALTAARDEAARCSGFWGRAAAKAGIERDKAQAALRAAEQRAERLDEAIRDTLGWIRRLASQAWGPEPLPEPQSEFSDGYFRVSVADYQAFGVAIADIERRALSAPRPVAPEAHEYEPRDCGGACLVCGCGKSAHVAPEAAE